MVSCESESMNIHNTRYPDVRRRIYVPVVGMSDGQETDRLTVVRASLANERPSSPGGRDAAAQLKEVFEETTELGLAHFCCRAAIH